MPAGIDRPILLDFPEQFESERLMLRPPKPGDGAAMNAAKLESLDALRPWMPWAQVASTVEEDEAICPAKSTSVRVGPNEGAGTCPVATSKLAISVKVPRRIYSNSRCSTSPGRIGLVGCLRSSA